MVGWREERARVVWLGAQIVRVMGEGLRVKQRLAERCGMLAGNKGDRVLARLVWWWWLLTKSPGEVSAKRARMKLRLACGGMNAREHTWWLAAW